MKSPPKSTDPVRQTLRVDRDGAAFFRRANRLAADPRVKFIFSRAVEAYETAVRALEPMAKGKGAPKVPSFFPFGEYEKIDCYVCGYQATADDIPETCPSCGAARYAFEKEVSQEGAWELVLRTTKDVLSFTKKAAAGLKDAKAKDALAKVAEIHKGLLDEAKGERTRVQGAAP